MPDEATGAPTCMGYDPGMLTRFRQTAACTVLPLVLALSCATGNPQSNRPGATAATPPVHANTASRDIRVRDVTPEYGNIDTDFNQDGIVELGIRPWETFAVSAGDKRVTIRFASTYSDVPEGAWVAFMTEDGTLRLARNLENAARTLGVEPGDTIRVHRLITE